MRIVVIFLLLVSQLAVAGADYVREKKWADEIIPGIMIGEPVFLELSQGHKFLSILTEVKDAKLAVVVVHGIGIHPDWNMVGTLRTQLAEHDYTTLSVQMPVLANDAKSAAYLPLFPEAVERIAVAVDYLQARGYKNIAIVSHSLGSAMSRAYAAKNSSRLVAWVSLGMQAYDYSGINIPVLDLYGEQDLPPVIKQARKRAASLKNIQKSRQVVVSGSDHFFNGHEAEMVQEVREFLGAMQ